VSVTPVLTASVVAVLRRGRMLDIAQVDFPAAIRTSLPSLRCAVSSVSDVDIIRSRG